MKHFKSIIGFSFLMLILACITLTFFNFDSQFLLIPVFGITVINLLAALYQYKKGQKSKAHTFMLSSLLILLIGGSSCVTIKFKRDRKVVPKPVIKQKDSVISMLTSKHN
ncbi:MAG: hypothetical protein ACOVMG_02925 [Flavobacterium sp.]